jgi:dihydrofolate reductase
MRKLKLQVQVSVDGYIATAGGRTDWMVWNWGEEWNWDDALKRYFNEMTETVDCILLSRKMAEEGYIDHWANVARKHARKQDGNLDGDEFRFAERITAAQKVVFTRTLEKSVWKNTVLAKGDLEYEIRKLKKADGKDIIVYGGAEFVSSLIRAGVIDEFQFFVNPSILGDGLSIFSEIGGIMDLTPVSAKSYSCGIAVLVYKSCKK